jgi:enolase-phosphatase E1
MGQQPKHTLFGSYSFLELAAAREAGFQTGWLVRPPLEASTQPRHPVFADFDAIAL